jgi:hypothetical protein
MAITRKAEEKPHVEGGAEHDQRRDRSAHVSQPVAQRHPGGARVNGTTAKPA